MDPKQTEGQNSGSGTLSTGANISRTMDALNVNERKSATSNSPFAKHHFDKVAPGTGDILIDPSAGNIISSAPAEKKGINRGRLIQFGLIFGGITLIALVIFTVVMVINNQPKKSNNSQSTATIGYQEAFNRYANWMISGEDSNADLTTEKLNNTNLYYAKKAFANKNEEKQFFKAAVALYEEYKAAFDKSSLTSYNSLSSITSSDYYNLSFYEKYIDELSYSETDLTKMALEYKDELKNHLDTIYNELQEQNPAANIFAGYGKQYSEQLSNWYQALRNNNCLTESGLDTECRNSMVSQLPELNEAYSKSLSLMVKMNDEASVAINTVLSDISIINKELEKPTENLKPDSQSGTETNKGEEQ